MIGNAHEGHELAADRSRTYAVSREVARNTPRLRERFALSTSYGASLFLFSYTLLHALSVAGLEPSFMERLSRVPLFAHLAASASLGVLGAAVGATATEPTARTLQRLPVWLGALTLLFVVTTVLFP
jgi:hypothetical protein